MKIGQCLTKLWHTKTGANFFRATMYTRQICDIAGTRLSLDAIKRRFQNSSSSQFSSSSSRDVSSALPGQASRPPPLFVADVVLVIPKIVVQPNFDSIQATLNKAVQTVVHVAEAVPQWEHLSTQQGNQKQVFITFFLIYL